jgi:2-dehydropantoate 2-reductase
MYILIYGAGAVGLGIASCLLKAGATLDIIAREYTVSLLRKEGLKRTGIFGDYYAKPDQFKAHSSLKDIPINKCDYLFVCTKSFDSQQAARDIFQYKGDLQSKTKIILFQNGWGNAEIFASYFPEEIIYNARVITGFSRLKPNEVTITVHADAIHIGSLFHKDIAGLHELCNLITRGGIPCEVNENIEKDLWAKMLYNCALNGLGAILNVPYGLLGESEYSRNLMKGVVKEIYMVIEREGYRTWWETPEDYLETFYGKLLPSTAQHESSTLQDIRAKKPTEIEALNGAVIQLAKKHQLSVPYNLFIFSMVKFIEERNFIDS